MTYLVSKLLSYVRMHDNKKPQKYGLEIFLQISLLTGFEFQNIVRLHFNTDELKMIIICNILLGKYTFEL